MGRPKNNHVFGPFFIPSAGVVRKSNPRHLLWYGMTLVATKLLPERTKGRQRGQRIVSGGKSRPARRVESKTGRGESISSAGIFVRNRRKSVCRSVCTCRFDGRKGLQYLRAVGLRPDSNDFRMQPYTPYAVPLKGKRPKRSNSQKRCIKYIRLFACPLSPTLHWLFARAEKVHTDCIRLHTKCIRNA